MKNYLFSLVILLFNFFSYAQNTYVPDDEFEQSLISLGYDSGPLDDYVPTANINTVTMLEISDSYITDLTGIEDFTMLEILFCGQNELTSLDFSNNLQLQRLFCNDNLLTHLDISQNTQIIRFNFSGNLLSSLNMKNGNHLNVLEHDFTDNPNLTCIEVDDPVYSSANWMNIDPTSSFSLFCGYSCPAPSGLTSNFTTTSEAELDWRENGLANVWDLEIGIQGFTPSGLPTENDIAQPYLWSGGLSGTNYDYYVRADCNADNIDVSVWVGPYTFSTLSKVACATDGFVPISNPFQGVQGSELNFADIDNDGDEDVLITGTPSSNSPPTSVVARLYRNDGMGGFSLISGTSFVGVYSGASDFADVDNDGDQDVLITGSNISNVPVTTLLYLNDGTGSFTVAPGNSFVNVRNSSVDFADVDGDNDQDVLISGIDSSFQYHSNLYLNNGAGVFTLTTNPFVGVLGSSLAFSDIDNDNDMDVLITGYAAGITFSARLYTNDGFGNFSYVSGTPFVPVISGDVVFGDIDNDNDEDVLIMGRDSFTSHGTYLYTNDGLGNFVLSAGQPFENYGLGSMDFADIDNDNDLDLVIAGIENTPTQRIANIFTNDSSGQFTLLPGTNLTGAGAGGVGFSDIDNDFDMDLLIIGSGFPLVADLYRNDILFETEYTINGWTNGFPSNSKCALISEDYTTQSFTSYKTTVTANTVLTIAANTFMEVEKDIINNGEIFVEHEGSIVQNDNNAMAINNGVINVRKTTPHLDSKDFMILGSPMSAETRQGVYGSGRRVLKHLTANFIPNPNVNSSTENFADDNNNNWVIHNSVLTLGEGYFVRPQPNQTVTGVFDLDYTLGTLNNGIINYNLLYNGSRVASANMLGNPYASAIDVDEFLGQNTLLDAVYYWEHLTPPVNNYPGFNQLNFNLGDISVYNEGSGGIAAANGTTIPSRYMASGQGFGVKALGAGTAFFNNSMRVTGPNTDYRSKQQETRQRIWLDVKNDAYHLASNALIAFTEEGTENFENGYDALRFDTPISLFSILSSGEELAIQGLGAFRQDNVIPLGFQTYVKEEQTYVISIRKVEGEELTDAPIYLYDREFDKYINLSKTDYTFSSSKGVFKKRFVLLFNDSLLSNNNFSIKRVSISPNPTSGIVQVYSPEISIERIEVIDLLGRIVTSKSHIAKNDYWVNLEGFKASIYFIKVYTSEGTLIKRVVKK